MVVYPLEFGLINYTYTHTMFGCFIDLRDDTILIAGWATSLLPFLLSFQKCHQVNQPTHRSTTIYYYRLKSRLTIAIYMSHKFQ